MPIYMDVHFVPGADARGVAEAHRMDMQIEEQHQCKCLTYWIDEQRESVFCLVEAPTEHAVNEMHRSSHGLIPHKIIEVNRNLVGAFLGRLFDPAEAEVTSDGLKVFQDSSFRALLLISVTDTILMKTRFGSEKAQTVLAGYYAIIRESVLVHQGREIEDKGSGILTSFSLAANAVTCAIDIERKLNDARANLRDFKIVVNAGLPVGKGDGLFGETIQLAQYMSEVVHPSTVLISSEVSELVAKDFVPDQLKNIGILTRHDESFLTTLFEKLEENYSDPGFDVSKLGKAMAMSKSQLYRKSIDVVGLSPVLVLKKFRLAKARQLMRTRRESISQITFTSGFSSPSYFTKCFKQEYGILPMTYVEFV
jgi:AraC-like DNA-binding protein